VDSTQLQVIALEKLFTMLSPRATKNRELKKAAMEADFLDALVHLLASKDADVLAAVLKVLSAVVSYRRGAHLDETKALIQRGFIQLLVPLLQWVVMSICFT
jgi:hypothetical protein